MQHRRTGEGATCGGSILTTRSETDRKRTLLCGLNQFFVEGGMTLADPSLVLPLFVRALGGSTALAGLVSSLRFFGWMLPQFVAARPVERRSRLLPLIAGLEAVRGGAYLLIAFGVVLLGARHPTGALVLFFLLFVLSRLAAGASGLARTELIARIIPDAQRSSMVSLRRLLGGVAGFLAGIAVQQVLERYGGTLISYAWLIGVSGISLGLAMILLGGVQEPGVKVAQPQGSLWQAVVQGRGILRGDSRYRLYLLVRAAGTGMTLAGPFYIVYATEVLGLPPSVAGLYIGIRTASRVLSNLYWGRQGRRRGSAWLMVMGSLMAWAAPTWLLLTSALGANLLSQSVAFRGMVLAGVFVAEGLSVSASGVGRILYLYDLAPADRRPTYFGLANTLLGPLYFLPAIGGGLVDQIGYMALFAAASGMLLVSTLLAVRLLRLGPPESEPTASGA